MQQKQAEAELRESQRRLATLIDSLPGMVFSCTNDLQWSMIYVSEGCTQLTGYRSEELIGTRSVSFDLITHRADLPRVIETINSAIARRQTYVVEYRIRTKSGQEKWVWEKGNGVFDPNNGQVLGIEGFITDITDLKCTEEALRQAEAKYRGIFENAVEGIFQTTPDGQYISANPALARLYGYASPQELMERLTDIEHQLYVNAHRRTDFSQELQARDAVSNFESQIYRRDGSTIWISENARAVRDRNGTLLYYEGTVEDITERVRAKALQGQLIESLERHAFYDSLTGLPNRALFMERLRASVERTKRCDHYLFALLFLDLDRFKVVNDSLGHLVGDQLLVGIARRLEVCLRSGDTFARLGGDEFTILLENIEDINNATRVAERIHKELLAPFHLDGHEVFSGVSIGIVLNRDLETGNCGPVCREKITSSQTLIYDRPEDLLRDADTALYRAKTLGKARYEVFNMTMHHNAVALLQLETDLRHIVEALKHQVWNIGETEHRQSFPSSMPHLQIHYQPIISLSTGRITGFEALLRLWHPQQGLVSPLEFLPVAEETGLIIPIGWWMLRQVCYQLRWWQQQRHRETSSTDLRSLSMNVNLSSRQIGHPDLIEQIDQILQETGLDGRSLNLEISESCLLKDPDGTIATLMQLRDRQINLCIDDFGIGYSSLSQLHQLPINALKIDRSFVKCLSLDEKPGNSCPSFSLQIIKTIVMLARNLGMEAIAEGVETAQHLAQLEDLNCEYAQGYFFSPPVEAESIDALISKVFPAFPSASSNS